MANTMSANSNILRTKEKTTNEEAWKSGINYRKLSSIFLESELYKI